MTTWRYYEHDGQRWCWNVEPIYSCPNAQVTEYVAHEDGEGGAHVLSGRDDEVTDAAQALGMDAVKLGLILTRGHQSHRAGRDRDDAGKLTDRCRVCGAKMRRDGFRAWRSQLMPAGKATDAERTSAHIGSRIFGSDGTVWRDDPCKWYDTKKEAKGWALEELKTARAVAA